MRTYLLGLAVATILILTVSASPDTQGAQDAWIVHVTDPHMFVDSVSDADRQDAATERDAEQKDKKTRRIARIDRQRTLNTAALKEVLMRASSLVGREGEPRLVVLTGDFDVDPCWTAKVPPEAPGEDSPTIVTKCLAQVDKTQRDNQVKQLVDAFSSSGVRDIYLVPGNNDIARELATDAPLKYFIDLIEDVQRSLTSQKSDVQLHLLVGCYRGGADTECFVDVAGTPYRILALPSYSFKNGTQSAFNTNNKIQEQQLAKFASLVDQSRVAGKRVIVVTHEPDVDDPYYLAQDLYAAQTRQRPDAKVANRSASSTWNVTKTVMDTWAAALGSDPVVAVLAGHLHDSHKEIYAQPYAWSSKDEYRVPMRKLFITPPLAVKNQDTSPIQARGFSLVHLWSDRVERRFYWYDPSTKLFQPEAPPAGPREDRSLWRGLFDGPTQLLRWVWRLDDSETPLMRLTILFIALLAAYLTVMQVWQIPPPIGVIATPEAKTDDKGTPKPAAPPAFEPSPFASNLGKTVIAGLGGLAAETVLKSLDGRAPNAQDKEFYIVWFVLSFGVLLLMLGAARAFGEAMRVRLAMVRFSAEPPVIPGSWGVLRSSWWRLKFHVRRFGVWLVSMRLPALTFLDTLINLIQGKNQTMTQALSDIVFDQQRTVVRAADTIRQHLLQVIERLLQQHAVIRSATHQHHLQSNFRLASLGFGVAPASHRSTCCSETECVVDGSRTSMFSTWQNQPARTKDRRERSRPLSPPLRKRSPLQPPHRGKCRVRP